MKKIITTISMGMLVVTAYAQWTTTNNGTVADTELDVRLTNPDSRHFSITNMNSSSEPVRLFLSGNSYGRGLQLGRNDGNHKIFITGDIDTYKSLRFYNTGGRYFSITNTDSSTEPAKLFLSGNSYSRGLQIGRDDGNHKILLTGNVGIGVTNPSAKLNVQDSNAGVIARFTSTSHGGLSGIRLQGETNDGSDVRFMDIAYDAETDSYGFGAGSYSSVLPISSGFSKADIVVNGSGKVGIGTTDFTGNHKLRVEGSIGAREIKVEATGWSDFVFENHYKLRTIEEVEQYINKNGHLPDIPSESEVTENGINLGEMNSKLLLKIEELTLYMIDMNKQVRQLKSENLELKEKVQSLEN